jgi:uncharacterized protein (TIGR01244 family)
MAVSQLFASRTVRLSNKRIFWLAALAGFGIVLGAAAYDRWKAPQALHVQRLTAEVSVSEQLEPGVIARLKRLGFAAVIDLRPDGEVEGQPSAAEVGAAVQRAGLVFAYMPVPHGDIPGDSVAALRDAMARSPRPVLLYCRSGRRAVRTWSLVEAERADGLTANEILAAVQSVGHSAADLRDAIERRVAQRKLDRGGAR